MKLKNIISKGLIVGLLFNNIGYSFANVKSLNERYETFEGDNITVNNILEEDTVGVEIEGNTLVNIHKKQRYSFNTQDIDYGKYEKVDSENSVKVTFNEQLIGWKYLKLGNLNLDLIKPNTTYTVYFEKAIGLEWIAFCHGDYLGHIGNETKVKVVNNKAVITTSDFLRENVSSNILLYGYTNATIGATTEVSNAMIFEGNLEYENLEYFEGMKSVGEIENNDLKVVVENKNLITKRAKYNNSNYNGLTLNTDDSGILYIDGTTTLNGDVSYTYSNKDFIKIKANTKYTIKPEVLDGTYESESPYKFAFKLEDDITGKIVWQTISSSYTFTCENPNTLSWIRLYFYDKVPRTFNNFQVRFQLEEGCSTDYELHEENEVLNNLLQPLRSLPNGVKDKILKRNGQWVVERRTAQVKFDGSDDEKWYLNGIHSKFAEISLIEAPIHSVVSDSFFYNENIVINNAKNPIGIRTAHCNGDYYGIRIKPYEKDDMTLDEFKSYLKNNPIEVVYQLPEVTYEPLNVPSNINLYKDTTYISVLSIIPANLKVTIDRVANRAQEAIEVAKFNPTIENLSQARFWSNLMKESILKDEFQSEINTNTNITDLTIEKKTSTSNMDVYIKSQNGLSMTISTNSIIFDEFDSTEDMEKLNAVNLTVNSSLPYQLNSYMMTEFKNKDNTEAIPKELFNIRLSGETDYKAFSNINEKLVLKENCQKGNNNQFNIDLILKGSLVHKADVYKTTLKFEAEQK